MIFKSGDRVCRTGDSDSRGTVTRASVVKGKRSLLVKWDNGTVTDVWAKDVRRSPDDGPESLKSLFRF